jgi:hypothetical protein
MLLLGNTKPIHAAATAVAANVAAAAAATAVMYNYSSLCSPSS